MSERQACTFGCRAQSREELVVKRRADRGSGVQAGGKDFFKIIRFLNHLVIKTTEQSKKNVKKRGVVE